MSRTKSVLNMMLMSWVAIITVTIAWVLYGDSLSFGKGNGFIGGLEYLGEHGLVHDASRVAGIPDLLFSAFQLAFAVTPQPDAGPARCWAAVVRGYDDALDVVGVHLVGGAFGALSLGFLTAYPLLSGQRKGLLYGGGIEQLGVQALGPVAVGLYSFAIAWILGKVIDKTMGFRVSEEDEVTGVDITQHAETAYDFGNVHAVHTAGVAPAGASKEAAARDAEPLRSR